MNLVLDNYNYWVSIVLMLIGFYGVINGGNLVKKLIGMSIFQTSVLLFYIAVSRIEGAASPILREGVTVYTNPLPHVLMLTAIVVGIATLAVGLAIVVRIKEAYGTIEEDEILAADNEASGHIRQREEGLEAKRAAGVKPAKRTRTAKKKPKARKAPSKKPRSKKA